MCAFCYASDSRGCTSVSVVKRFIALGERYGWAMKSYLSELCSFRTRTTDCRTLVLEILKVRAATLPPGSCCYVHVTGNGCCKEALAEEKRRLWGRASYLSFAMKQEGDWTTGLLLSGMRAPGSIDFCREWEITFQIVLICYVNYNSEKYWSERPHPC